MSPHLSQWNVVIAHRNYLGEIICKSSNWQHIQILKITILGANWQLFRLERIAKCSYFILSTQNIKFYWFVMKIKKFMLPIWYNRGLFPLRNKYLWVFVLNGLMLRSYGLGTLADCLPPERHNSGLLNECRHLLYFPKIQSCNTKFWAIQSSAPLSKLKWIGLDNFLKWQKWCKWVFHGFIALKLCGKEGCPQRPNMRRGRVKLASNSLPRRLSW